MVYDKILYTFKINKTNELIKVEKHKIPYGIELTLMKVEVEKDCKIIIENINESIEP